MVKIKLKAEFFKRGISSRWKIIDKDGDKRVIDKRIPSGKKKEMFRTISLGLDWSFGNSKKVLEAKAPERVAGALFILDEIDTEKEEFDNWKELDPDELINLIIATGGAEMLGEKYLEVNE